MAKSSKPKTPEQQIFDTITYLIDNPPTAQFILENVFGERRLPELFRVHEPEKGKFMVLQEFDKGVVQYVDAGAVRAAVTKFTRSLSSDHAEYKLTQKLQAAVDYWLHASVPVQEEIKPVLQLSEPGKTFRRLDFDADRSMPTPLFDDFVGHMETNAQAFLEFCGSLFDATAQRQNYVWLYGQGQDGKGTWARFLHKIFGGAFAALSDDHKMHNQFWTYQCVGKRVGVFSDVTNSRFVCSGLFQQLTGDDVVPCERKGKDVIGMRLETMFFFLSNSLPELTSQRSALRRAIVCKMRERRPDEIVDPHTYEERLWAERAGIVAKCIEAWYSAKAASGGIVPDQNVARDIAEDNEDPFEAAFYKCFVESAEGEARKTEVFDCLSQEYRWPSQQVRRFYDWLERVKGIHQVRPLGNKPRVFRGMKFAKSMAHYQRADEAAEGGPEY